MVSRTKALVLELLAAVCLVRGGHEIILSAFDNFKEVWPVRKGEPGGGRGGGRPVRPYILNRAVPDNDSALEKCFSSRFLATSKGSRPFVDRSEAPVQRCNMEQPAQPSGKTVLCVLRRFVGLIRAEKSKEADVKRCPLLTLACLDEVFWLLLGRVRAKSSLILHPKNIRRLRFM